MSSIDPLAEFGIGFVFLLKCMCKPVGNVSKKILIKLNFILYLKFSSGDFKNFANYRPAASNFKGFSSIRITFFLTVGQNNFENKIPFLNEGQQNIFYNFTLEAIF